MPRVEAARSLAFRGRGWGDPHPAVKLDRRLVARRDRVHLRLVLRRLRRRPDPDAPGPVGGPRRRFRRPRAGVKRCRPRLRPVLRVRIRPPVLAHPAGFARVGPQRRDALLLIQPACCVSFRFTRRVGGLAARDGQMDAGRPAAGESAGVEVFVPWARLQNHENIIYRDGDSPAVSNYCISTDHKKS